MKRTLNFLVAWLALFGAIVCLVMGNRAAASAYVAGEALFVANLLLLVYGGQYFLQTFAVQPGQVRRRASAWLLLGIAVKVILLGGGAFLSLVTLRLRVDFFAAGLCTGLLTFALLTYVVESRRQLAG